MAIDHRRRTIAKGMVLLGLGVTDHRIAAQPSEQVIRIVAKKFAFTPSEIRLKKGIPAVLEFTTTDVVMGFNAPALGVRTDILPGQVARVRVVPGRTGTFDVTCDIFCGSGHEEMSGTITVVD